MSASAPTRERKTFSFQTKEFDDAQGIVRGYLSTFDNIDDGGDRVRPGAFKRTLSNKYKYKQQHNTAYLFPLLWQHSMNEPIGGYLEAKEDKVGLYVELQIDLDIQRGKEAYSALKKGYVFQQSIGYEVLDSEYVKVDGETVRDLKEVRLWEGSIVTLPMNELAVVTDVKSLDDLDMKAVCGNTSGPLGPRDESWDGSKAEGQIWDAAYNEETKKINTSLAKKYFMVCDGDAQKKGSYGYPFWYVGSDPHICVGAVKAIAGAASGARGASAPDGIKGKVETLYRRISAKYPDDPELTPPWNDDGKRSPMTTTASTKQIEKKTFGEHLAEEMCEDLLEDWQDVLVCSLSKAVLDAFKIGDEPEADVRDALTAFSDAVLAWVAQGVQYDLSAYLQENAPDYNPADYTIQYGSESKPDNGYYGYMSHSRSLLGRKAGRAISADNAGKIQGHIDDVHDMADAHLKATKAHVKALHGVADNMAGMLPATATGDEHNNSDNDQQDDTKKAASLGTTRRSEARPSMQDTVTDDEIAAALGNIRLLRQPITTS